MSLKTGSDHNASAAPLNSRALSTYYRRMMTFGTLGFLLIIGWTVSNGWKTQYAAELSLADQRVQQSAIRLQSVIRIAADQITQLRYWAEEFPRYSPYAGAHSIRQAATRALNASSNGEFNLDDLSVLPDEQRLGQILALSDAAKLRADGRPTALDLGVSLLDRMGYARRTSDFLRWTYFFSGNQDLLALTPWDSSQHALADEPNIRSFLKHSWSYDVTMGGLPANNRLRASYWTKAYLDQGGAGLMVSHAAPVYWGDDFVGIVGTDVLLGFLGQFLRDFPDPNGLLLIANEYGQVLGDRRAQAHATENTDIAEVNGVVPIKIPREPMRSGWHGKVIDGYHVFATTTVDPEWTIYYLLPQATILERVVNAYRAQILLAVLLVIGVAVVHFLLWRRYVEPALRIAELVAQESEIGRSDAPAVPSHWQPWLDAMNRAFNDRRSFLQELKASKEELEQRVDERTRELLAANAQLETLAATDPLTGAFNRRYLFDLLETERQRILRGGEVMSVLLIDLDHFKRINDGYGHAAGDIVLCEVVKRCVHILRTTDVICRYGGEEFVVFLPAVGSEGAALLAERLLAEIASSPVACGSDAINVTVSIGVASYTETESIGNLFSRADKRLYQAKAQGRNRVVAT